MNISFALVKKSIWVRYLNLLLLLLFMSSVPMPVNKGVLALCAAGSLVGTIITHIIYMASGNQLATVYALLASDLLMVGASVYVTGLIVSPFFVLLPLIFICLYYIELEVRKTLRIGVICLLAYFVSLALFLYRNETVPAWNARDYPVYILLAAVVQCGALVTFFLFSIQLPKPILQELASRENELAKLQQKAVLGTCLAGVAHEIRTPLSSLMVSVDLLESAMGKDGAGKREDIAGYASVMRGSISGIDRLVNSILSYARERRGHYYFAVHEPSNVVGAAVEFTRMRYRDARPAIKVVREDGTPREVVMDKDAIYQVLVNLLDNSVKARDNGRPFGIEVRIAGLEDVLVIEVSDTGRGIPAAMAQNMFKEFYTDSAEGVGIGLFISKGIIGDHEGAISVQSVEGVGTKFRITLPAKGPREAGVSSGRNLKA